MAAPLPDGKKGSVVRKDPQAGGRVATRLLAVTLLVLTAAAAVVSVAAALGQVRVATVLTGSMTPRMPVGSLVVARPTTAEALRVGQVVMFVPPAPFTPPGNRPVVHRILALTRVDGELVVRTKGDANAAPDPWTLDAAHTTMFRAAYSSGVAGRLLQDGGRTAPLVLLVLPVVWASRRALRLIWRTSGPAAAPRGKHRAARAVRSDRPGFRRPHAGV